MSALVAGQPVEQALAAEDESSADPLVRDAVPLDLLEK
jgi:hypothetical protein